MNKVEKGLRDILEYVDKGDKNEFYIIFSSGLLPKNILSKINIRPEKAYNLYDVYFYLDSKKIIVEYLYKYYQYENSLVVDRLAIQLSTVTANKIMKSLLDGYYKEATEVLGKRMFNIIAETQSFISKIELQT